MKVSGSVKRDGTGLGNAVTLIKVTAMQSLPTISTLNADLLRLH